MGAAASNAGRGGEGAAGRDPAGRPTTDGQPVDRSVESTHDGEEEEEDGRAAARTPAAAASSAAASADFKDQCDDAGQRAAPARSGGGGGNGGGNGGGGITPPPPSSSRLGPPSHLSTGSSSGNGRRAGNDMTETTMASPPLSESSSSYATAAETLLPHHDAPDDAHDDDHHDDERADGPPARRTIDASSEDDRRVGRRQRQQGTVSTATARSSAPPAAAGPQETRSAEAAAEAAAEEAAAEEEAAQLRGSHREAARTEPSSFRGDHHREQGISPPRPLCGPTREDVAETKAAPLQARAPSSSPSSEKRKTNNKEAAPESSERPSPAKHTRPAGAEAALAAQVGASSRYSGSDGPEHPSAPPVAAAAAEVDCPGGSIGNGTPPPSPRTTTTDEPTSRTDGAADAPSPDRSSAGRVRRTDDRATAAPAPSAAVAATLRRDAESAESPGGAAGPPPEPSVPAPPAPAPAPAGTDGGDDETSSAPSTVSAAAGTAPREGDPPTASSSFSSSSSSSSAPSGFFEGDGWECQHCALVNCSVGRRECAMCRSEKPKRKELGRPDEGADDGAAAAALPAAAVDPSTAAAPALDSSGQGPTGTAHGPDAPEAPGGAAGRGGSPPVSPSGEGRRNAPPPVVLPPTRSDCASYHPFPPPRAAPHAAARHRGGPAGTCCPHPSHRPPHPPRRAVPPNPAAPAGGERGSDKKEAGTKTKASTTTTKKKKTDAKEDAKKEKKKKDPAAPKKVRNAFVFFGREVRPAIAEEFPSTKPVEAARVLGERWRALGPDGKKRFEDMVARDGVRYRAERETYEKEGQRRQQGGGGDEPSGSSPEITANAAAAAAAAAHHPEEEDGHPLSSPKPSSESSMSISPGGSSVAKGNKNRPGKRSNEKTRKKKKDPAAPRRPCGAFVFFGNEMRPVIRKEIPGMKLMETSRILSERWRALGPDGRKRFEDAAAQDRIRFQVEQEMYEEEQIRHREQEEEEAEEPLRSSSEITATAIAPRPAVPALDQALNSSRESATASPKPAETNSPNPSSKGAAKALTAAPRPAVPALDQALHSTREPATASPKPYEETAPPPKQVRRTPPIQRDTILSLQRHLLRARDANNSSASLSPHSTAGPNASARLPLSGGRSRSTSPGPLRKRVISLPPESSNGPNLSVPNLQNVGNEGDPAALSGGISVPTTGVEAGKKSNGSTSGKTTTSDDAAGSKNATTSDNAATCPSESTSSKASTVGHLPKASSNPTSSDPNASSSEAPPTSSSSFRQHVTSPHSSSDGGNTSATYPLDEDFDSSDDDLDYGMVGLQGRPLAVRRQQQESQKQQQHSSAGLAVQGEGLAPTGPSAVVATSTTPTTSNTARSDGNENHPDHSHPSDMTCAAPTAPVTTGRPTDRPSPVQPGRSEVRSRSAEAKTTTARGTVSKEMGRESVNAMGLPKTPRDVQGMQGDIQASHAFFSSPEEGEITENAEVTSVTSTTLATLRTTVSLPPFHRDNRIGLCYTTDATTHGSLGSLPMITEVERGSCFDAVLPNEDGKSLAVWVQSVGGKNQAGGGHGKLRDDLVEMQLVSRSNAVEVVLLVSRKPGGETAPSTNAAAAAATAGTNAMHSNTRLAPSSPNDAEQQHQKPSRKIQPVPSVDDEDFFPNTNDDDETAHSRPQPRLDLGNDPYPAGNVNEDDFDESAAIPNDALPVAEPDNYRAAGDYPKAWICDKCKIATFDTFQEAEEHELACTGGGSGAVADSVANSASRFSSTVESFSSELLTPTKALRLVERSNLRVMVGGTCVSPPKSKKRRAESSGDGKENGAGTKKKKKRKRKHESAAIATVTAVDKTQSASDPTIPTYEMTVTLPPSGTKIGLSYTTTPGCFPHLTSTTPDSCFRTVLPDLDGLNEGAGTKQKADVWVLSIDGRDQTSTTKSKFRDELKNLQLDGRSNTVSVVLAVRGPSPHAPSAVATKVVSPGTLVDGAGDADVSMEDATGRTAVDEIGPDGTCPNKASAVDALLELASPNMSTEMPAEAPVENAGASEDLPSHLATATAVTANVVACGQGQGVADQKVGNVTEGGAKVDTASPSTPTVGTRDAPSKLQPETTAALPMASPPLPVASPTKDQNADVASSSFNNANQQPRATLRDEEFLPNVLTAEDDDAGAVAAPTSQIDGMGATAKPAISSVQGSQAIALPTNSKAQSSILDTTRPPTDDVDDAMELDLQSDDASPPLPEADASGTPMPEQESTKAAVSEGEQLHVAPADGSAGGAASPPQASSSETATSLSVGTPNHVVQGADAETEGANPQQDTDQVGTVSTNSSVALAQKPRWIVLKKSVPRMYYRQESSDGSESTTLDEEAGDGKGGVNTREVRLLSRDVIQRTVDTLVATTYKDKEGSASDILRVELEITDEITPLSSGRERGLAKERDWLIVASRDVSLAQKALDTLGRHITNALSFENMRALLLSESSVEVTLDLTQEIRRRRDHQGGDDDQDANNDGAPAPTDRGLGCVLQSITGGGGSSLQTSCGVLTGRPRPGSIFDAVIGRDVYGASPVVLVRVNGCAVGTPSDVRSNWRKANMSRSSSFSSSSRDGVNERVTLCLRLRDVSVVKLIQKMEHIVDGGIRHVDGSIINSLHPEEDVSDGEVSDSPPSLPHPSHDATSLGDDVNPEHTSTASSMQGMSSSAGRERSDGHLPHALESAESANKSGEDDVRSRIIEERKVKPSTRDCTKYSDMDEPSPSIAIVAAKMNLSPTRRNSGARENIRKVSFHGEGPSSNRRNPRACISHVDGLPIESSRPRHNGRDIASAYRFTASRQIAPAFAANKKKGEGNTASHSFVEVYSCNTSCTVCKSRKTKILFCQCCGICRDCSRKKACPDANKFKQKCSMVTKFDQAKMLGRRYQGALQMAFGLAKISTVGFDDTDDTFDTQLEIMAALRKVENRHSVNVDPSLAAVHALLAHNKKLIESSLESSSSAPEHVGRTALFAAVLLFDHSAVLTLLLNGANTRHKDSKKKRPLDYAKLFHRACAKDIQKLAADSSKSSSLLKEKNESLQDWKLKCDILEIFNCSERIADDCQAVRSWSTVEISVKGVIGLQLSDEGMKQAASDEYFCQVSWGGKKKGYVTNVVPQITNEAMIDWRKSRKYQFRVNSDLDWTFKNKEIQFDIYKGLPDGEKVLLSTISEFGETVNAAATDTEEVGSFPVEASEFLQSPGSLHVGIQRLPYDISYERDKSVDLSNKLSKIIDLVESVQKRLRRGQQAALMANYLSLLHCAVHVESTELVKRLLSLGLGGARERGGKSLSSSTPLDVAQSITEPSAAIQDILVMFGVKVAPALPNSTRGLHQDQNFASSNLPVLENRRWREPQNSTRCWYFNSFTPTHKGCQFKRMCKNAHVYEPITVTHGSVPASDALSRAYKVNFNFCLQQSSCKTHQARGKDGTMWYTAGLACPVERTIYYAAGGVNGRESLQGIFWYPNDRDAIAAVAVVVLDAFKHRNLRSAAVEGYDRRIDGGVAGSSPKRSREEANAGSNKRMHIEGPGAFRDEITPSVPREVEKNDEDSVSNLSDPTEVNSALASRSPRRSGAYHVQGASSLTDLRSMRSIDMPALLMNFPQDWMLLPPKRAPCFPYRERGYTGCQLGSACKFAHVFKSLEPTPAKAVPPSGALAHAYQVNFGVTLQDHHYIRLNERSRDGRTFFTSALKCPEEETIYVAEGGAGCLSKDKIYWYTTQASADAAVDGVVLNAFRDRGMQVSFTAPTIDASPPESNGSAEILPPLPVEEDLQAIYDVVFRRGLPNACFQVTSDFDQDGRKVFTTVLSSPAQAGRRYYPRGNGGKKMRRSWWYTDERTAKKAVMSVLAADLEKRGIIPSALDLVGRKYHK